MLQHLVSATRAYNILIFVTFPLSGICMYGLARKYEVGALGAFASGLFYTFSTFHYAHAQAQMHIASMQWLPLFLCALVKTAKTLRSRDAAILGVSAAVAFLASIYNVLVGGIAAMVLIGTWSRWRWTLALVWRHVRLSMIAAGVFAIVAGWLVVGMAGSAFAEPYLGSHNSVTFSADLESFFLPNAVSALSRFVHRFSAWSGAPWETATYIGYAPLVLGLLAALRSRVALVFLLIAGIGGVLALGPVLHIGGTLYTGIVMPDRLIDVAFPLLRFSGLPVRFAWLTTLGVAMAGGVGIALVAARGRIGTFVAIVVMTLGLVEQWPRPFVVTTKDRPTILTAMSTESGQWAVLDTTTWSQQLVNQMNHKHPIIGGYLSRVPSSRWRAVADDPVLTTLVPPPVGTSVSRTPEPSQLLDRLHQLRIRFVIVDDARVGAIAEANLVPIYRDEKMAIFEVPS
jgi:hypothetical protein